MFSINPGIQTILLNSTQRLKVSRLYPPRVIEILRVSYKRPKRESKVFNLSLILPVNSSANLLPQQSIPNCLYSLSGLRMVYVHLNGLLIPCFCR